MKRDIIAKLLAQENLTILRTNASTASFDVKNRVLKLPAWQDITNHEELLMKLHEVGHALYTPLDMDPSHRKFHASINIVEDARIERMIKDKYRGAAHIMKLGYKGLIEKDFFGIADQDLNNLGIMDKINLHFKIGDQVQVPLGEVEQKFVTRIEQADDYSDIVHLAHELYLLAKSEQEEKEKQEFQGDPIPENDSPSDFSDSPNPQADSQNPFEDQDQNSDNSDSDENSDESGKPTEDNSDSDENSEDDSEDELEDDSEDLTKTQSNFNDNLKNTLKDNTTVISTFVPKRHNWKNIMVPYKEFYKEIDITEIEDRSYAQEEFAKFHRQSKKAVAILAAEFNRRKSARDYRKSYSSKTGDLDVSKVWQYQFSDDIFKTTTISPTGKNHGFVMYVDWSGSMTDKIIDTVKQTIMLAQFARKINVPFEVILFSDHWYDLEPNGYDFLDPGKAIEEIGAGTPNPLPNELIGNHYTKFLQALSSTMSNSEFKASINKFLVVAASAGYGRSSLRWHAIPHKYNLGSTPLNATLVYGLSFVEDFVKNNRIEKMNLIVLTDGEDSNSFNKYVDPENPSRTQNINYYSSSSDSAILQVHDEKTHKTYDLRKIQNYNYYVMGRDALTTTFLQMYKDRYNATVTGIYVGSKHDLYRKIKRRDYNVRSKHQSNLRKTGFSEFPSDGYDANFLVQAADNSYEDEEIKKPNPNKKGVITKGAYATSFKKSLQAKAINKNMLKRISAVIA